MATAIDPRIQDMPVKEIISALVQLCENNRTKAAGLMGISRQRMDAMAESGKKDQEVYKALEEARKTLKISKSALWDILIGAKKK